MMPRVVLVRYQSALVCALPHLVVSPFHAGNGVVMLNKNEHHQFYAPLPHTSHLVTQTCYLQMMRKELLLASLIVIKMPDMWSWKFGKLKGNWGNTTCIL